jgi:hypothetical protein
MMRIACQAGILVEITRLVITGSAARIVLEVITVLRRRRLDIISLVWPEGKVAGDELVKSDELVACGKI